MTCCPTQSVKQIQPKKSSNSKVWTNGDLMKAAPVAFCNVWPRVLEPPFEKQSETEPCIQKHEQHICDPNTNRVLTESHPNGTCNHPRKSFHYLRRRAILRKQLDSVHASNTGVKVITTTPTTVPQLIPICPSTRAAMKAPYSQLKASPDTFSAMTFKTTSTRILETQKSQ